MKKRVFASGELFVSGRGEVTIDEEVPKSRALLVHPEKYIHVELGRHDNVLAPCGCNGHVDAVDWELFMQPGPHPAGHQPEEHLRLKIKWNLESFRTITWQVEVPA